jgi:heptosyltransferase-2
MKNLSARKKILIRGVNWIGDAVLTIPAIHAVRRSHPGARISLLVRPWVSDIFKGDPSIDEIILYDDSFKGLGGKFRLARTLRQKGFDTAILLQNAFDAALITWLARIPERIGYKRDMRGPLLTNAVPVKNDGPKRHQVHYYLDLIRSAGIKAEHKDPYIFLSDEERDRARHLMQRGPSGPVVGINPGATYGSAKRWPEERFADLIKRCIAEMDARVVIFGGPSEVEIADEILKKLSSINPELSSRILPMAGKTGIRELASLISECDAFVTNDSGPMHIASALYVPTLAIFGSTDSVATGPLGDGHKVINSDLPCSPCLERECPEGHLRCMTEITSEKAFSALKDMISKVRAVFLDKDGTLIRDMNYLNSFDGLEVLPGVREGLKGLKEAGFSLIGITNQSGVARGLVDEGFVTESNAYLQKELGIDDFYYCPHHPDENCPCRKPEPMLILKARLRHGIDLRGSYMIGDKESDVLLAKRTGMKGILLSHGGPDPGTGASYVAGDLCDALMWISRDRTG